MGQREQWSDVAGREQAEAAGIKTFTRVDAPNDARDFVEALANVVRGELAAWDSASSGATLPGASRPRPRESRRLLEWTHRMMRATSSRRSPTSFVANWRHGTARAVE